jgi:Ran GTPase-activating protein (RanGAP) involved in mRNA processing and transport
MEQVVVVGDGAGTGGGGVTTDTDTDDAADDAHAHAHAPADDDANETQLIVRYQEPDVKSPVCLGFLWGGDLARNRERDEKILQLLAADADIDHLHLTTGSVLSDDTAEKVGTAISKNTHLKKLQITNTNSIYSPNATFFTWLAHNRSIEHLSLHQFDHSYGYDNDIFKWLAPFFVHNQNLRCIEITRPSLMSHVVPALASALLQSRFLHLERIDLRSNGISDEKIALIINAINSNPGVQYLIELLLDDNKIGKGGCTALSVLLKLACCNLNCLDLGVNQLDDECIAILTDAMSDNRSLKWLGIGGQEHITGLGWRSLSTFLSDPRCSMIMLALAGSTFYPDRNGALSSLGQSLAINKTLALLNLSEIHMTPVGWQDFSKCLSDPASTLEQIDLGQCNMDDVGAVAFYSALAKNKSLTVLKMVNVESITPIGWCTCFELLVNNNSSETTIALEDLHLSCNTINDDGAALLVTLITKTLSTMETLRIRDSANITVNGWRTLATTLLPDSSSKLLELVMGMTPSEEWHDNAVDETVLLACAAALARNTSLERLYIGATSSSYDAEIAFANALCDISSISAVCQSNHTLYESDICDFLSIDDYDEEEEGLEFFKLWNHQFPGFDKLLKSNALVNTSEVVREKLLLFFFSNANNVGSTFIPMPLSVMPSAIEFIGRDRIGYSVMYSLVQSMPSLLLDVAKPDVSHDCALLERPPKLPKLMK